MSSWDGTSAPWLFTACDEQGVEGIVLKRRFFELPAGGTIAGLAATLTGGGAVLLLGPVLMLAVLFGVIYGAVRLAIRHEQRASEREGTVERRG